MASIPGFSLVSGTFDLAKLNATFQVDGSPDTFGPVPQPYSQFPAVGSAMIALAQASVTALASQVPDIPATRAKIANVTTLISQGQAILTAETDQTQKARWSTFLNALNAAVT